MADPFTKRIELCFRHLLIRIVNRVARRPKRERPLDLSPTASILLIRHDRLGDAIISTAAMQMLRDRYPAARIDILLGHRNAAVSALLPAVDRVHVVRRGIAGLLAIIGALRRERYDVVINLLANSSASGALLTIAVRARCRIGFAGELAGIYDFAVPVAAGQMHIVVETTLLLSPLGIAAAGDPPVRPVELLKLRIDPDTVAPPERLDDQRPARVVFSISAPGPSRSWPDQKVVALLSELVDRNISWTIAGTPDHAERVAAIARASGASVMPATPSYAEFLRMLASFDIVITPQTSTVHASSALRRPTILLNTDSDSDCQWTPWGVPHRTIAHGDTVAAISVEAVADALRSLLDELLIARD